MLFLIKTYIKNHIKHFLFITALGFPVVLFLFLNSPGVKFLGFFVKNPIYSKLPIWAIVIFVFITFSAVSFIMFFLINIVLTSRRNIEDKKSARLQNLFSKLIISYLYPREYNPKELTQVLNRIKRFLRNGFNKKQFLISITKVAEVINTDFSFMYSSLVNKLNLNGMIESLLYSANLSEKVLAMHIIYYLDLSTEDHIKTILKYTESRNFALRTESYVTLIRLMKDENQLVEFMGKKYKLSMFDINIIVESLINHPELKINFLKLLSSEKTRKILVGLLLASYRYRDNSKSIILILNQLENENLKVRRLAWDAYLSLVPEQEGFDLIKENYHKLDFSIQLMIMRHFEFQNREHEIEFLDEIIMSEHILIKLEALRHMMRLSFKTFAKYIEIDDPVMQMVCKEAIDTNIN